MTSVNLEAFTLREVATAIANGEISCVEATQACIDRAQLVQPTLNCFIHLDAEGALEKATAADKVLRSGENVGPLHGVPMAHKDAFYRRGRITTCGSAIRATFVPETTATVLERLDAAGAIELGTLHLGEFAASGTGHNAFFGNCRNPLEHRLYPRRFLKRFGGCGGLESRVRVAGDGYQRVPSMASVSLRSRRTSADQRIRQRIWGSRPIMDNRCCRPHGPNGRGRWRGLLRNRRL